MAWYKQPIRPIDPIVPDSQDNQSIRYVRDNFTGNGQDSFTNPPAQDPAQWQQLLNVMPVFDGSLNRRWGNLLLTSSTVDQPGTYIAHLYSYQRTDGLRKIMASFGGVTGYGVSSYNEDGTGEVTNIFSRTAGSPSFRLVASRNYAYAYNGTTLQKSDGTNPATNWGINVNGVTNSSNAKFAGGFSGAAWTGGINAEGANNGTNATFGQNAAGTTPALQLNTYALSVSGTVLGIQADCYVGASATAVPPKTIRPTQNSASGTGVFVTPANAYDGNLNTAGTIEAIPISASQSITETGIIFGMPAVGSPSPATLTLTIKASGSNNSDPGANGSGHCEYSLNGGSTWTSLFTFSANGQGGGTFNIPLATTQNTTLIQVRGVVFAHNGTNLTQAQSDSTISIYEVYVTATYASGATAVTLNAQLVKNGVAYGQLKTKSIVVNANSVYTLGNQTDLWQGSWLASDVTPANFGINLSFTTNGGATCNVDAARITVSMSGAGPSITSTASAGSVTLVAGRTYYLAAKNSLTGHYSDLSQASPSSGAITSKQIALSLPVFTDPQVDTKVLLATADGNDPSILYQVVELANATTTYNDNTPDTSLVLNQVLLTTDDLGNEVGVSNNTPPPSITLAIKHKGRIWGAVNQNLYFSKSVTELTLPNGFVAGKYEEAWPAANYFDVSMGAENIRGLLSDGQTLYIGTERHIRMLYGDNPDNFQVPEIIHQEVGLLNQDVWVPVYLEGTPSGAMWITPDFRVIGSDFNTYQDLGHPIQDVLNSINVSAATSIAHAMFVSQGSFDLYILAIPTGTNTFCDTHCVFDLRHRQWFIWQPTDQSTSMLFNVNAAGVPQWLWASSFAPTATTVAVFQYTSSTTTDRSAINGVDPVVFPVSATTSWMHLGSPTQRKVLNEVDVIGDQTMTVSVFGASTQAEFVSPNVITANEPLTLDSLGHWKVFLAGLPSKNRYYQLTFNSLGDPVDFIDSYNILVIPQTAL